MPTAEQLAVIESHRMKKMEERLSREREKKSLHVQLEESGWRLAYLPVGYLYSDRGSQIHLTIAGKRTGLIPLPGVGAVVSEAVVFTFQSERDEFSRPAARRVLAGRIEAGETLHISYLTPIPPAGRPDRLYNRQVKQNRGLAIAQALTERAIRRPDKLPPYLDTRHGSNPERDFLSVLIDGKFRPGHSLSLQEWIDETFSPETRAMIEKANESYY